MLPNGPIRKVIMLKVKFEDLKKFSLTRSSELETYKLSKFFENYFFAQMLPNGPIRKVNKWSKLNKLNKLNKSNKYASRTSSTC